MSILQTRDDRQTRALFGLSGERLGLLEAAFRKVYERTKQELYEKEVENRTRKRARGGGRKGALTTTREKLLFVLYYFKTYPTFDNLGAIFGLSKAAACDNVHRLRPILYASLVELGVMPVREFANVAELEEAIRGFDQVIIDVMERSHQRPKDFEKQKEMYSGKKKDTP